MTANGDDWASMPKLGAGVSWQFATEHPHTPPGRTPFLPPPCCLLFLSLLVHILPRTNSPGATSLGLEEKEVHNPYTVF